MKQLRAMEEEESEIRMAESLLLLSRIDQTTAAAAAAPRFFECKTCNKQFPSFQALGGHRAFHKKPRFVFELKTRNRQFPSFQALGGHRASHRNVRNEKPQVLIERISVLKRIGYHEMDGTELGEVKGIWNGIQRLTKDADIRVVVPHFRSMLRSFTNDDDGGVPPTTLSHRRFRNYCSTLLSKLVGDTISGSAGSAREHGGITDIESGLPYFVRRPNVYQYLRGRASSSRTTNTAGTLMGDGRRHNQAPKMKEFRNFAYWMTALFITILISLLSANKRQPQVLFRLCGGFVIGATICCIAMLMLLLIRPSSQRALTCLKLMQYLTIGLLFLVAVLVFTLL